MICYHKLKCIYIYIYMCARARVCVCVIKIIACKLKGFNLATCYIFQMRVNIKKLEITEK